jgi:S1-C subfamily serine protease
MTRILLSLLILFFITSCGSTSVSYKQSISPPTESFVKVTKVLTVNKCKDNKPCRLGEFASTGSGISIGTFGMDSLILTAGHVCSRSPNMESQLGHIDTFNYQILSQDIKGNLYNSIVFRVAMNPITQTDLCMLIVRNSNIRGILLSSKKPEVGDKIYNIAAPVGIFHPPTVPIIDGIFSGNIPDTTSSMVTLPAIGGSSGSAILNEDMELVGILFATHPYFNVVTLSSNYSETMKFIHNCFLDLLRN